MTRIIILFLMATFALNCCQNDNRKPLVFHYSKLLEIESLYQNPYDNKEYWSKVEYIIVENTQGYSDDEIRFFICKYERKLRTNFDIIELKYSQFSRSYYKESKKTPIDFVDDPGGFSTDVIWEHVDDFICKIEMEKTILQNDSLAVQWKNNCDCLK